MEMTTFIKTRCKKANPTQNHRPAVWECMLGTVEAMNDEREVQYFDYDWDAALKFAGVSQERDPRVAKNTQRVSWTRKGEQVPFNKLVLWVIK